MLYKVFDVFKFIINYNIIDKYYGFLNIVYKICIYVYVVVNVFVLIVICFGCFVVVMRGVLDKDCCFLIVSDLL